MKYFKQLFSAIRTGFADGKEQPYELTSGMTWEDNQDANELYDRAVNAGQFIGRLGLACHAFRAALAAN